MLSRLIVLPVVAAVTSGVLFAGVSYADEAHCNSDKFKSLSKSLSSLLRCSARTTMAADPPDPDCPNDATTRLAEGFAQAEEDPQCAASGEAGDVATAMRALEEDLRNLFLHTFPGRTCAAGKMRVVAKRAKAELSCRRRAALSGTPVDPACFSDAQSDLIEGFEYREQHGTCSTTGDAPQAEALVADFLEAASLRIQGRVATDFSAVVNGADIDLVWTAPDDPDLTHARVVRRLNAEPAGPDDPAAVVVFNGTGTTATDDLRALLPDTTGTARTYHYAVYGCTSLVDCQSNATRAALVPTVRQALVAGGYVIHWRHAAADVCADRLDLGTADTTSVPDWWKSCDSNCGTATARQINATGIADSIAIGDAFDTLGITVGRVLTSEFCRNVQTAVNMDFGPVIEESQELTYYVYDEASRCADTFVMLGEAPAAGTNTALIGHAGNTCPPLSQMAWGEAAIYKPDGMGGTTYIDRVLKDAWLALP